MWSSGSPSRSRTTRATPAREWTSYRVIHDVRILSTSVLLLIGPIVLWGAPMALATTFSLQQQRAAQRAACRAPPSFRVVVSCHRRRQWDTRPAPPPAARSACFCLSAVHVGVQCGGVSVCMCDEGERALHLIFYSSQAQRPHRAQSEKGSNIRGRRISPPALFVGFWVLKGTLPRKKFRLRRHLPILDNPGALFGNTTQKCADSVDSPRPIKSDTLISWNVSAKNGFADPYLHRCE